MIEPKKLYYMITKRLLTNLQEIKKPYLDEHTEAELVLLNKFISETKKIVTFTSKTFTKTKSFVVHCNNAIRFNETGVKTFFKEEIEKEKKDTNKELFINKLIWSLAELKNKKMRSSRKPLLVSLYENQEWLNYRSIVHEARESFIYQTYTPVDALHIAKHVLRSEEIKKWGYGAGLFLEISKNKPLLYLNFFRDGAGTLKIELSKINLDLYTLRNGIMCFNTILFQEEYM